MAHQGGSTPPQQPSPWQGWRPPPPGAAPVPPAWQYRTDPPRPPAMDKAVWLMRAGAALTVLSTAVGLLVDNPGDGPFLGSSSDEGRGGAIVGAYVGVFFATGLNVALWLWMAWANGQGKSWARTVATVFGSINIALLLPAVALTLASDSLNLYSSGAAAIVSVAFHAVVAGIGGWAIWLMYRPESRAFYTFNDIPRYLPPHPQYGPYAPNTPHPHVSPPPGPPQAGPPPAAHDAQ
jgi:hypothetical protein